MVINDLNIKIIFVLFSITTNLIFNENNFFIKTKNIIYFNIIIFIDKTKKKIF